MKAAAEGEARAEEIFESAAKEEAKVQSGGGKRKRKDETSSSSSSSLSACDRKPKTLTEAISRLQLSAVPRVMACRETEACCKGSGRQTF